MSRPSRSSSWPTRRPQTRRTTTRATAVTTAHQIIVNTTLLASTAVLLETALSYLGFGIKAPDVSLGTMISQYQSAFSTRPYLFWWPGLFIIIIALSVNFIGDGLRDAFDPRQKRVPSARKMARALRKERAEAGATGDSA